MPRKIEKLLASLLLFALSLPVTGGQTSQTSNEPPGPKPTEVVQRLIDDATRLLETKPQEAFAKFDEALVKAKAEKDLPGEALVYRVLASIFDFIKEERQSAELWEKAAELCEIIGDGPCRVKSLVGLLTSKTSATEADALIQTAVSLARSEKVRPRAAAEALLFGAQVCVVRKDLIHGEQLASAALELVEHQEPGSVLVAESLDILAVIAHRQNRSNVAQQLFTREAQLLAAKPDKARRMFATLIWVGDNLLREEKAKESFEFYEWAINTLEKSGFEPKYLARVTYNIAETENTSAAFDSATIHYERALKFQEKVKVESTETAEILMRLGKNLQDKGALTDARVKFQDALSLNLRINPNTPHLAHSYHYMGTILQDFGDFTGAIQHHQKALELRRVLEPDSLAVAASLYELGFVARFQGDLKLANQYLRDALAIEEKLAPHSNTLALTLESLAGVAFDLGDFLTARWYDQRSLTIKNELDVNPLHLAVSYNNLGLVAVMLGDLVEGEQNLNKALELKRRVAPLSFTTANTLDALGALALMKGDDKLSIEYKREALTIREKIAPDTLDHALSLTSIAITLLPDNIDEAKTYLERARRIYSKVAPNSLFSAAVLLGLASVAESRNDFKQAAELGEEAWKLIRRHSSALSGDESRQRFGSARASIFSTRLVRWQMLLKRYRDAMVTIEESRAQALLQLLSERRAMVETTAGSFWATHRLALERQHKAEEVMRRSSTAHANALDELTEARKNGASSQVIAQINKRVQAKATELQQAQAQYVAASNETSRNWEKVKEQAGLSTTSVDLERGLKSLPADAVFISFSVGESNTYIFVWRAKDSSSPIVKEVPVGEDQLRKLVLDFKRKVSNRNSDEDELLNEGRALFGLLFSKEAVTALREAKQLIISPDGPLWELPFAALPVTEEESTSEYMGLKTPIVYAQSLALFKHSRDAAAGSVKTGKTQAVVLGNPLFSVNPGTSDQSDRIRSEREYLYGSSPPSQLPGATIEAQKIAGLYQTTPLTDKSATEAALRRVIEQADVVHLATHGKYDQRRVMSSGILLANGTESREINNNDDGVLQAWEIYSQLKLKAELLVLSACESGRGENVQGEGIVGLTRALQYAGAHSVVASQWLVNDTSAQKLMVAFHELLLQNKPKDQALQQAMSLINSHPATKHPYYWASFILLGDTVNHRLGKVGKSQ